MYLFLIFNLLIYSLLVLIFVRYIGWKRSLFLIIVIILLSGFFILSRCSSLLEYSSLVLSIIIVLGAMTAFFTSCMSLVQKDFKESIEYYISNQLGFGYIYICYHLKSFFIFLFFLIRNFFFIRKFFFFIKDNLFFKLHTYTIFKKLYIISNNLYFFGIFTSALTKGSSISKYKVICTLIDPVVCKKLFLSEKTLYDHEKVHIYSELASLKKGEMWLSLRQNTLQSKGYKPFDGLRYIPDTREIIEKVEFKSHADSAMRIDNITTNDSAYSKAGVDSRKVECHTERGYMDMVKRVGDLNEEGKLELDWFINSTYKLGAQATLESIEEMEYVINSAVEYNSTLSGKRNVEGMWNWCFRNPDLVFECIKDHIKP